MPLTRIVTALLAMAYPAVVYFGLDVVSPRVLGIGLLVLLLLRHGRSVAAVLRSTDLLERSLLAGIAALSASIVATDSELLLRLYPVLLSLGMLALFARSLRRPPSLVERFARQQDPDLSPAGVRYTYRVTQVWCLFLATNALIALATVFGSRELWVLWNGLLSYLAMGALFAGEWLLRRRLLQRMEHA